MSLPIDLALDEWLRANDPDGVRPHNADLYQALELADLIAEAYPIEAERPAEAAVWHDRALAEVAGSFPVVLVHHCPAGVEMAVMHANRFTPSNRFRFAADDAERAEVAIASLEAGGATPVEVEVIP